MTCVFFGNKNAGVGYEEKLICVLKELIEQGVDNFYVGNHGDFDKMVISTLKKLKNEFKHINYAVALAYLPKDQPEYETVYPIEVSVAPMKFRIDRRNRWMLEQADIVVTYVINIAGNSAKYKEQAIKKGKRVIEIS